LAGADPIRSCAQHGPHGSEISDSTGGFYFQLAAMTVDDFESFDGGAAGFAETRGCLDEIRTALIHETASELDLSGIQQSSFDNHLADLIHAGGFDRADDLPQFGLNFRSLAALESTNVHEHVDFVGSVAKRLLRFRELCAGGIRAERKAYDRTDFHGSAGQCIAAERHVTRIHANREETPFSGFSAQRPDTGFGGILLQIGVVEFTSEFVFRDQRCVANRCAESVSLTSFCNTDNILRRDNRAFVGRTGTITERFAWCPIAG
jgi:hypothetical protein